tara:strand:+ start:874 stop:1056 length:183 start_codon:yes stop_codon:yes gene_type:complete
MKVYNLTIVYNDDTDEVEYIEETVEEVTKSVNFYASIAKEEYDKTTTIDILSRIKDKAEA